MIIEIMITNKGFRKKENDIDKNIMYEMYTGVE